MNYANFKTAKLCTKIVKYFCIFFFVFAIDVSFAWEVDLSRRIEFSSTKDKDLLSNSSPKEASMSALFSGVLEVAEPTQDIVILNTEKGFIPDKISLWKNATYKIHVVNVNSQEKNVSFVMDAFSQHHGTYFGERKEFVISPKVEGVFSFQCPERSTQGKLIVMPTKERKLAAER